MGIWARRIIEIKMADPSFKFEDESDFIDFLDDEIEVYGSLQDGGGTIDVPLNVLRKAIRKAEELHISHETVSCLKKDIKHAVRNQDESVTYSCF